MESLLIAVKAYVAILVVLAISIAVGDAALTAAGYRKISGRTFRQLFFKLLAGLVLLVTVYSIFCTGFRTINTGFPVMLVLVLIAGRKKFSESPPDRRHLLSAPEWGRFFLLMSAAGLLFVFWSASGFLKGGGFHFSFLSMEDYVIYGYVSDYIRQSGEENYFSSSLLIDPSYSGTTPYHYFELWLNAAVRVLSGFSPLVSLMLVAYPVLYSVVLLGILAMIEHYSVIRFRHVAAALLLMFSSGIYFSFFSEIPYIAQSDVFAIIPMGYFRKFMVYYVFIVASALFFQEGKKYMAVCCLLCLPLISADTAMGVFGGIAAVLLFNFRLRMFDSREWKQVAITTAVMFFFLFAFYLITGNKQSNTANVTSGLSTLFDLRDLRTRFNILAVSTVQLTSVHIIFIAVFLILFRRSGGRQLYVQFFLLVASVLTFALIGWAVFFKLLNSYQFFKNIAISAGNVLLIFFTVRFVFDRAVRMQLTPARRFLAMVPLAILVFSFFAFNRERLDFMRQPLPNAYSDEYLVSVLDYMNDQENLRGVSLRSGPAYLSGETLNLMAITLPLGEYLVFSDKPVVPFEIGIFNVPFGSDTLMNVRIRDLIGNLPFGRFVSRQRLEGKFKSVEESQIEFVKANGIDFIIHDAGSPLPEFLSPHVVRSFKDSRSGEQFHILNI